MERPIEVPRFLGISWWWLVVFAIIEGGVRYHFHWRKLDSLNILDVWLYLQAIWLKRAVTRSRAIYWLVSSDLLNVGLALLIAHGTKVPGWLETAIGAVVTGLGVVGVFACMWAMERYCNEGDPVGLKLSRVMTFFFNVLYFQYHFHEIYQRRHEDSLSLTPFAA